MNKQQHLLMRPGNIRTKGDISGIAQGMAIIGSSGYYKEAPTGSCSLKA
jgi:hypothetical protein